MCILLRMHIGTLVIHTNIIRTGYVTNMYHNYTLVFMFVCTRAYLNEFMGKVYRITRV
jgi:hypothetical protein